MTQGANAIAGEQAAQNAQSVAQATRDWQAVRHAGDIQFAPMPSTKAPLPPDWLVQLGKILESIFAPVGRALGVSWPVLQWVLIALAAAGVALIVWRLLAPLLGRARPTKAAREPDWSPDRTQALALLEDADRLAAEGRFAEATHLLLQRSVGQIAAVRPDWLHPASTAREIAALPSLPERARLAFTAIATRVEHSRYALRELTASDWSAAREAYAQFALASQALPTA